MARDRCRTRTGPVRMGPGGLGFGWCCTAAERTIDSTQHRKHREAVGSQDQDSVRLPCKCGTNADCRPARRPSVTPSLRKWDFTDMGDRISRSTQPPSTNPTWLAEVLPFQ